MSPRDPIRRREPRSPGLPHELQGFVPEGPDQLHVVIHGLVGVRLIEQQAVELHIPLVEAVKHGEHEMAGHVYKVGTFGNLQDLEADQRYSLEGVLPGRWRSQRGDDDKDKLVVRLKTHGLRFEPNGTHAKIVLPWPNQLRGTRQLMSHLSPDPLFVIKSGREKINPRSLLYIMFLSYDLEPDRRPTLNRAGTPTWQQYTVNRHNRLHLFADPPHQLIEPHEFQLHVKHAYDAFNRQLFSPPCDLEANARFKPYVYADPEDIPEIPANEQVDLAQEMLTEIRVGCTGNCLAVMITDD